MSNSIVTKENLAYVAGAMEAEAPIMKLVTQKIDNQFGPGTGDIVNVAVSGYGTTHQTTDLTGLISDIDKAPVPVQVKPYRKGATMTKIEEALDIDNFEDDVAKPFGSEMVYKLGNVVYNAGFYGSNYSVVSAGTFDALSEAIVMVENSLMSGSIAGLLSNNAHAAVVRSGDTTFGTSPLAKDIYNGVIGDFMGAEFVKGKGLPTITTTSIITTAATATHSGVEGVATLTFSAAQTLKKGTAFQLTGVYAVNELGESTDELRTFIVQADVAASTSVNVGPIYFEGPRKNVSGAAITTVTAINILEASTTYYTGLVFNQNDLIVAIKGIKPFASNSDTLKTTKGFPLRMSIQSDNVTNTEVVTWDILMGAASYVGRGSCAFYVKK